jgi:hypothetical protein
VLEEGKKFAGLKDPHYWTTAGIFLCDSGFILFHGEAAIPAGSVAPSLPESILAAWARIICTMLSNVKVLSSEVEWKQR